MSATVVVVTPARFADAAARVIAGRIGDAIVTRHGCSIALCGGSTPIPVYQRLAALPLDWASIDVFFGDERAVPPEHADSNYRMAREALIDRLQMAPRTLARMPADRPDRDAAAADYDRLLPGQLDVLLLGVGSDGHTASLFPESPAIAETGRRVVAVASPRPPLRPQVARMTITPLVLASARQIVVMVTGEEKASILARILDGPDRPTEFPAQLARRATWVLDAPAAGQLQPREH